MRLWEKIALPIVLIVISTFIAIGVWQSNNIRSAVMFLTKSTDQIAAEMNANKQKLEKELQEKYPTIISDFTAEEERMIIKGDLSVEEAIDIINKRYEEKKKDLNNNQDSVTGTQRNTEKSSVNHATSSEEQEAASSTNSPSENRADNEKNSNSGNTDMNKGGTSTSNGASNVDLIVGDRIVQLYSLKAMYLGQLGQLEAQVKSEYISLPKEKRNLVGKQNIANKYMGQALGYMNSCDAQVAEILSGLESDLRAANADTSIIKTIQAAYENEKAMKKAYYLKLLD